MLTIHIPGSLTNRIHGIAKESCRTAEEFILETLQDQIDHVSAYSKMEHLAKSATNFRRLLNRFQRETRKDCCSFAKKFDQTRRESYSAEEEFCLTKLLSCLTAKEFG